jgi:TM2 domain-containing membrane protein YozV
MRPLSDDKFCQSCGGETIPAQEICIKCGVRLRGNSGSKLISGGNKSVTLAWILSLLLPGVGQIYLGQVVKGIAMIAGGIILTAITGGLAGIVVWFVGVFDAIKIGRKLEAGKSVGEWEFF